MGLMLNQAQQELLNKDGEVQKEKDRVAAKVSARIIQNSYGVDKKTALQIAEYEVKYSRKYGIPLAVGLAITAKESGFKNGLVSTNGSSFGLKQINCFWHCKAFGTSKEELRTNVEKNIEFGYKILADNIRRTGSLQKGLAAYLGTGDSEQDMMYAQRVLAMSKQFDVGVT